MPIAIGSKAFDPAAHLERQGWKGKGTALKQGHLTRPLAVVHKKCLGGVGKNRDEAVPFWDNIFAATAASISLPTSLLPSPTSTPGPASGSSTPTYRLADPRSNKSGSWQTSGSAEASSSSSSYGAQKGKAGLSIACRVGQENARRGLYSKFFRGQVLRSGGEDEDEIDEEAEAEAGTSAGNDRTISTVEIKTVATLTADTVTKRFETAPSSSISKIGAEKQETKEERRVRREARKLKKAAKEERKLAKAKRRADEMESIPTSLPTEEAQTAPPASTSREEERREKKRRTDKRRELSAANAGEIDATGGATAEGERDKDEKKERKTRRRAGKEKAAAAVALTVAN